MSKIISFPSITDFVFFVAEDIISLEKNGKSTIIIGINERKGNVFLSLFNCGKKLDDDTFFKCNNDNIINKYCGIINSYCFNQKHGFGNMNQ